MGAVMAVFTPDEIKAVVRWLESHQQWLWHQRMQIECGDDYAFSNGKWPAVKSLERTESTVSALIELAKRDQKERADA